MTKKDLNNWIMYHEIHHLNRLGFSNRKIATFLGLNTRTVAKYLNMDERAYEQHLLGSVQKSKLLDPYEDFVHGRLSRYPDTSAAQIHDWLKEAHPFLPPVSSRTVYNFVMYIRQKHGIPYQPPVRDYFPIEELPYGEQAQVDFGEYNLRQPSGKRKKVYFFVIVLSRSRMKYVYFENKPFTAETVCKAHENSFKFYGGIPKTIVYDQDRTMVVDENLGDIILTDTFRRYTKSQSFNLHFCRKADPESKGKVENVVQYVKKNFLYNRVYSDIETLNTEAEAWLSRTANNVPHNRTKKSPESEFVIEKEQLKPYTPVIIQNNNPNMYIVRKDNTVNYKSNFYTLPQGTYKASGINVLLEEKDGDLKIFNTKHELIATHKLCLLQGELISNTNHKRDTSLKLDELLKQASEKFTDHNLAMEYFLRIKKHLPRYTRDHIQAITKSLSGTSTDIADKTLAYCQTKNILNGNEWARILQVFASENTQQDQSIQEELLLLDKNNSEKASQTPKTSNIDDYEKLVNP